MNVALFNLWSGLEVRRGPGSNLKQNAVVAIEYFVTPEKDKDAKTRKSASLAPTFLLLGKVAALSNGESRKTQYVLHYHSFSGSAVTSASSGWALAGSAPLQPPQFLRQPFQAGLRFWNN